MIVYHLNGNIMSEHYHSNGIPEGIWRYCSERGVGISSGIGLGAEVSMYETETLESISFTWDQSDNVNSQATSGNTSWSVGNKRPLDDGTWVGNVSIGVGKDKVTTDTLIYSTDEKTWMLKQYENLAREAEGF